MPSRFWKLGVATGPPLACSGSAESDGAKQLTGLYQTLLECENNIKDSCSDSSLPTNDNTLMAECSKTIELFEKKASECLALSKRARAGDACSCWTDPQI